MVVQSDGKQPPYPQQWRVEVQWYGEPAEPSEPCWVLLHHGLGSVSAWRDFPARLAAATGQAVVAYSRFGYGNSTAAGEFPWPVDFMHRAAAIELPAVLRALAVEAPLLVGHSDGASIALLYAAAPDIMPRPRGMALVAPHVLVEERTLAGARTAVAAFGRGELRHGLARHHRDPDGAFGGWSSAWLRPEFRDWNIEAAAERVACPLVLVQGLDDVYGTRRHVDSIASRYPGEAATLLLDDCPHDPMRDRPAETLAALVGLSRSVV